MEMVTRRRRGPARNSKWVVYVERQVIKTLEKLPKNVVVAFWWAVERMKEEGAYPRGFNVSRMKGSDKDKLRMVIGNYRMIYRELNERVLIEVIKFKHRQGVYKKKGRNK